MPEIPTCECVRAQAPYDRLTSIYQAAAELARDATLPDVLCVAGVAPFQRFAYIYAALRVMAADNSLPSMECVEGEPIASQVSRIYQAAAIYAADGDLLSYECVRGMPMWQQWVEVYRALYVAAGSPEDLTDPACVPPTLDVLSEVFCALVAGCVTPELLSATIDSTGQFITLVFSENVTSSGAAFSIRDGNTLTFEYVSGGGTDTLLFSLDPDAGVGETYLLEYAQEEGDTTSGDCPLLSIVNFPVTNNAGLDFTFLRPDGTSTYFRPDGTSIYLRP